MSNIVRIGLAAAAVVILAVVVINLVPGSPQVGSGATPTPIPSTEASGEPTPAGRLEEGPFALWDGTLDGGASIIVTIPAPGWSGDPNGGILVKNHTVDPPDGAGMIVFAEDLYVYGDPCQWSTTRPDTPATTVDELVAALAAQALRDASQPVDITIDGYAGKSITLHVPDDAVFADCDQGYFGSWGTDSEPGAARYHQGPGQIDELYILDVGGVLTVIDTAYYAGTPAEHVAELYAIVASATFELP